MHSFHRCLVGTLAVAAALLAFGQRDAAAQSAVTSEKAALDPAPVRVLRPGDMIRLKIWRENELSGDYVIDEEGIVVLPLLGPREVTGISPDSIKIALVEEYAEYLTHRSIDVIPMWRINVLGAVNKPGLYPVDATMTIADVLALAGGATSQGKTDKFDLIRDGETISAKVTQQTLVGQLPIRSGDQLFVREKNWISRNAGVVGTIISATVSIILAVTRNK